MIKRIGEIINNIVMVICETLLVLSRRYEKHFKKLRKYKYILDRIIEANKIAIIIIVVGIIIFIPYAIARLDSVQLLPFFIGIFEISMVLWVANKIDEWW